MKHYRILFLLLFTCFLAGNGYVQAQSLTIEGGSQGSDYTNESSVITIKTSTALTVSGTTTTDRIVIEGSVTANLTINDIDIQISSNSPISVTENATLNLTISGNNKLKSNSNGSGINVPKDATLMINATSLSDKLETYGETGIGANNEAGTITINNGTIIATGRYGAGIGGAIQSGHGGTVTINGGYVYAKGKSDSAGIGGGGRYGDGSSTGGNGGSLTITGGVVVVEHIGHGDPGHQSNTGTALIINSNNSTPIIISKTIDVNGVSSPSKSGNYLLTENGAGSVVGAVTLTGEVTIPEGATVTVGSGSSLTIADGAALTVEGTIKVEGGTLTNNGTIDNKGTITGDISGSGKVKKPFEKVAIGTIDSKEYTGSAIIPDITITDGGYTLEKDKDYTLSYGDNTDAGKAKITITPIGEIYYGNAVEKEFTIARKEVTVTLQSEVSKVYDGTTTISNVSLTLNNVITEDQNNVSLNTANYTFTFNRSDVADAITINISQSPALEGPKAGNYILKSPELKGKITPAILTVTPKANQFVYADEKKSYMPEYSYSGTVTGQTAAFSGKLTWDKSVITKGDLDLTNGSGFRKENYKLIVDETVNYTSYSENLADAKVSNSTAPENAGNNDWYKGNITLTAPADFKIKKATAPVLYAEDEWTATSITFEEEGEYEAWYQLKRDDRTTPNAAKSIAIKLDKTAPEIGIIQEAGSSFTILLTDATSGIATITYTLNNDTEVTVPAGFIPGDKSYTLSIPAGYGKHTIIVTVTDMAGLSTTDTRSIKLVDPTPPDIPIPPVDPTPPITPTVYYTVTLPAVEGAVTDPEAGEYDVESWSNFHFYLTLDKAYDKSLPIVTTDRGETITPRSSDNAYIIKQVRSDVQIRIDGIIKNPDPVANEKIEANHPKVWKTGNELHIQAVTDEPGYIYTADGKLQTVCHLIAGEVETVRLPDGIYFVRIGKERFKIVL